jgi:asparagine synthase (glutamine-hydrolysing)
VGGRSLPEDVERLLRHYDEPFADSSAVPSLALARALAGRYKVVLNGDGGDEAFGGYPHYQHIRIKQKIKTVAAGLGLCDRGYIQSKAAFRTSERLSLLNGNGRPQSLDRLLASDPFLENAKGSDALGRAMWSDRHLYLPNNLTYKMDVALASVGIEGRAPFLDHRLLEWAQSLSARDLVRGNQKKILLREAYRGILPDEVLSRPTQGFGAPVREWLRGPLRNLAQDLLPCPLLDRVAQKNLSGQRLWTLIMFSAWARQWRAIW